MPVQNFGGLTPPPKKKKLGGQKHAKFGSVLDDFKIWQQMSPERMMFKIGQVHFVP